MVKRDPLPVGRGKGEGDVDRARRLRQNQTDVEKKLWSLLRNRQLLGCKFRRQHPIGRYVVDFCCLEKKVVIELDGGQHAQQRTHDSERTLDIENQGFRVFRFWNNQIIENPRGVFERIASVLNSPHLNPLPDGERK